MKILKKGNRFVAYNNNNESLGSINIETEKFVGNTVCMVALINKLDAYNKAKKNDKIKINLELTFADKTISKNDIAEIVTKVVAALAHEVNCGNGLAPENADTYTEKIVATSGVVVSEIKF